MHICELCMGKCIYVHFKYTQPNNTNKQWPVYFIKNVRNIKVIFLSICHKLFVIIKFNERDKQLSP